jgi:hypothetical protein
VRKSQKAGATQQVSGHLGIDNAEEIRDWLKSASFSSESPLKKTVSEGLDALVSRFYATKQDDGLALLAREKMGQNVKNEGDKSNLPPELEVKANQLYSQLKFKERGLSREDARKLVGSLMTLLKVERDEGEDDPATAGKRCRKCGFRNLRTATVCKSCGTGL